MRRLWWLPAVIVIIVLLGLGAEIVVLGSVADLIGFWPTLLLIVASAFLGVWLTRREGSKAWQALVEAITSGRMPTGPLAEAALILVGGLLLIAPGFISDGIGLLFLLPVTRPVVRSAVGFVAGRAAAPRQASPTVVEGEVIPDSEPPSGPTVIKGELEN